MRRTLSLILTLVMIIGIITSVPLTASAADVSGLTFYLNEDEQSYTVYCDGIVSDNLVIPDTYRDLPVTGIDFSAFRDCENLTSVTIPDTVTSIGFSAFSNCTSLKSVNIPDGVKIIEDYAFYGCCSLVSVNIPESVTSIGFSAFADCTSLKSVNIPDGVKSIGEDAFRDCCSLVSINIPESVASIGDNAFNGCEQLHSIIVPDSVESIGNGAFNNTGYYADSDNWENGVLYIGKHLIKADSSLSGEYIIKDNTKTILGGAFYGCENLSSVTIPDSVTSIEAGVFSTCYALESINVNENNGYYLSDSGVLFNKDKTVLIKYPAYKIDAAYKIPDGVKIIGDNSFATCENLQSITISDSVTSIGKFAFEFCRNLQSITIPDSVNNIGSSAFFECVYCDNDDNWEDGVLYIGNHLIEADQSLSTGYKIKDGTKTIAGNAFNHCEELTSITIPVSVTGIGDHAFFSCESLTEVNIPRGVTNIGEFAFGWCENLTSVQIHGDVETMGECVFEQCSSLATVLVGGETNIGERAFADCKNLTSVTLDNGVKSIGYYSFAWCEKIESILIPDSLTTISTGAFHLCDNLTSVQIGKGIESIDGGAFNCSNIESVYISSLEAWLNITFEECSNPLDGANLYLNGELVKDLVIPDGVESIGDYAFSRCKSIETVTIPDSVTRIGEEAFIACYNLNGVYIEDLSAWCNIEFSDEDSNPLQGANYLYLNNKLLTDLVIPQDITQIGDYTFENCYCIQSVVMHENVTSLGESILNFAQLDSIDVDENNKYYSSINGVLFNKDETTLIRYTSGNWESEYKIPDSVTNIDERAFFNCYYLERVEIPGNVKDISDSAFNGCNYLTSLRIADGVERIGKEAFFGCYRLTEVTIPSSVTSIGYNAFGYYFDYDVDPENDIKVDGFTIYGVPGTAAETYAIENGFTFIEGTNDECWHSSTEWILIEEPTVYGPGEQHKECTECGEILEVLEMPQLKCSKPGMKSVSNSGKDVKISWSSVSGADYYYVYRKVSGGSYSYIGKTTKTSFTDDSAKAGKTYTYRVRAKNEAGYSAYSSTKTVKHLDQPSLKSAENTTAGVKITWGKVSSASGYKVYRKTSDGWKYLGKTSKTYFTDQTAKSGKKYTYSVKAYSGDYNSSYSSSGLSKYYLADPTLKTPSSTKKGVVLKWSKVTGADGYVIYYKTGSEGYKKLTTVKGGSKITYTHTKATKGKTYTYKVKAYKSKTYSAFSNAKKIKDKY